MKTAVIIGRFQIDHLTPGHTHFLMRVKQIAEKVVILLGTTEAITDKNPLNFDLRAKMIEDYIKVDKVLKLHDMPSDEAWSKQVDFILDQYENPTLYCSRDGFKDRYYGKYPVVEIESAIPQISATTQRKQIKENFKLFNNIDFRRGVIYAHESRFPIVYPTVDIAVLKLSESYDKPLKSLLLGKKPTGTGWQLPGGFVDPSDKDLISAAARELSEEVKGIQTHEFEYVGSHKINDFRYKGTKDGIMTSLFATWIMGGDPQPADDFSGGELKWFDINTLDINIVAKVHQPLIEMVRNYLQ